jgi:hypothetical protein
MLSSTQRQPSALDGEKTIGTFCVPHLTEAAILRSPAVHKM